MGLRRIFSGLITILFAAGIQAQNAPKSVVHPADHSQGFHKIESQIHIDGLLDEGDWRLQDFINWDQPSRELTPAIIPFLSNKDSLLGWYGNFIQYYPYDTSASKTKTKFRLLYTSKALYIGVICENRTPLKNFVINGLKRDFSVTNTDAVVITLSPYNDGQNGFSFGISPFNMQREGAVENGGGFGVTTAWDQVWHSATKLGDGYWTAEIMIPLNSVRFVPGVDHWEVNVSRFDLKNNEISNFARVPRNFNVSTLVFAKPMYFLGGPLEKKTRNLVLVPYVSGNAIQPMRGKPYEISPKIGFDAKLGVSRSLNLDITANPDFAQVDVDVQQVNLTRFSLFFPERRQFFIENSDLFASFGFRQIRPFFSRRIGLSDYGAVPIIGGVRLSGKLGTGLRIGAMNITTGSLPNYGVKSTNYSVFALQKKVFSASNIGFIGVHDQKLDTQKDYNTVLGLEFNLLTKNNRWGGKGFVQKSLYPGLDGNKGFAHATWLRYKNLNWFLMWNHEYVSKDFRARTGFVPRIANIDTAGKIKLFDYWRLEPQIQRTWYPKGSKLVNNYSVNAYNSSYYDSMFKMTESESELGCSTALQNSALAYFSINHTYQRLFIPFKPFAKLPTFYGEHQWMSLHGEFTSNNRKPIYCYSEVLYGGYYLGKKLEFTGELNYRLPPMGKQHLPRWVVSGNWNLIRVNDVASQVNAKVNLFGVKVEHSFSTICYLTSYFQYNSQANRMNINIRFQYRYRPMSDIFVVFSQNWNQQYLSPGLVDYRWQSMVRSLAVKWVYWLNT